MTRFSSAWTSPLVAFIILRPRSTSYRRWPPVVALCAVATFTALFVVLSLIYG